MAQNERTDSAFMRTSLYGSIAEPTYSGALSFMRRKYTRDLTGVDIAVTGVPYDLATTNRPGTRFGPAAIRAASAQLAWGPQWPWGFDPFERLAVVDYGDCLFDHGKPESAPKAIEAHLEAIVGAGISTITLGGDHFVTLPILRAYAKHHGPLSLVHFDAHSDTWPDDGSRIDHGTMFWYAVKEGIIDPHTSVQVGIRTHNSDPLGITWLDAAFVHEHGTAKTISEIKRIVGTKKAYLTFDIDCLDPSYAPGTGTPVSGGLATQQAQAIVRGLHDIAFVGMDMVVVAPDYDISQITALAACHIIHDYVCLRANNLPSQV